MRWNDLKAAARGPSAERSGFSSALRYWLSGRGELALAFIRQ
jgi:hypothetical protein